MTDLPLRAYVRARTALLVLPRNEAGEGVISTAIAVLIMAALGALMWVGFRTMWTGTESATNNQISSIGR